MRRYSNSASLPPAMVRETASIAPPAGEVQCSSTVSDPLALTQLPAIHATAAIAADARGAAVCADGTVTARIANRAAAACLRMIMARILRRGRPARLEQMRPGERLDESRRLLVRRRLEHRGGHLRRRELAFFEIELGLHRDGEIEELVRAGHVAAHR